MKRILALILGLAVLAGCAGGNDLNQRPVPLGDFSLGHNVVVASKMQMGPVSREASEEEWKAVLTKAIDDRFGRYEGEGLYHLGVSVEGYMLAPTGVPVLYKPKSALIINVTVWDDEAGRKYHDEPHQITVLETTDTESFVVGSGATRSKGEQMAGLSYNAVKAIETWLVEQHEQWGWFTDSPTYNPPREEKPQPTK